MPSPFPGMDPYLESPALWMEVHSRLIVAIADALAPSLRPKYRIAVEQRVYFQTPDENVLIGIPDATITTQTSSSPAAVTPPRVAPTATTALVSPSPQTIQVSLPMPEEVQERYLEVRHVTTGKVVTVIELLSPKNKRNGEGRMAYNSKRQQILVSDSHLIEIDLLRGGDRLSLGLPVLSADYYILISRTQERPKADLIPFTVRDPIPQFALPLMPEEPSLLVDLQAILQGVYERAGFDLAIDYTQAPIPPLRTWDVDWAIAQIKILDRP